MYDTVEEATQKLVNSVVLYKDLPVMIIKAGGSKNKVSLAYTPLPVIGADRSLDKALIEDPGWDFKDLGSRLGYVSVQSPQTGVYETVFTARIPTRHSRQGLDERTVSIKFPNLDPPEWDYRWSTLVERGGLVTTLKGLYNTSKEAFDLITKNPKTVRSQPISRKLLLYYDRINPPNLVYRNEKIGYTEDGETFKLAIHKQYLKEELTDMVGLKIA